MSLPSQTRKAPKGGSGSFQLFTLNAGLTAIAAEITSVAYTNGIANIPVSALTGTKQKENLAFTADVEINEQTFGTSIDALTFSGSISESEKKYENGETFNDIVIPSNAVYCLVHHYSQPIDDPTAASKVRKITTMVGVMVDDTGTVITTVDVFNTTKISFKAVAAPETITFTSPGVGDYNSDLVTVASWTLTKGEYADVNYAASV